MHILEKIKQYITKHNLINQNDTIIIGLSGGPDSVFLLHTLIALQEKYNLTLIAAHLNHEWRPEANAEEEMCCNIAKQFNVTFVSAKLSSLPITKKHTGSKEEFARTMRRQFLEQVSRDHHADRIALGHHAQDQQETFFIRLIRGTSLAGLTGMHPQHGLYIRPLLETNKSDILEWLKTHNITYAIDTSNESDEYLRNRIRSKVIPALAECDERWNTNFLTTINRLKQDEELLQAIACNAYKELIEIEKSKSIFNVSSLKDMHPTLRYRVIVLWLIDNQVQFSSTQAFLDEIIRFLSNPRGGTHVIHDQWSIIKKQNKALIVKLM